jgi:phosphate transport system permease protein
MTATLPERHAPPPELPVPRTIVDRPSGGDRVFRGVVVTGAWASVAVLGLIAVFLGREALPSIRLAGLGAFITRFEWHPDGSPPVFGIAAVVAGTLVIASIALVVAVPVAVGLALFVNEYAPPRLAPVVRSLVDLLAAVPSLVYGMWGLYWLQPRLQGTSRFLADHLGFVPIFRVDRPVFGSSMFVCGLVLAVMVLPIVASVSGDVLRQVPRLACEGALALGGTRWGMIRLVVLPFGRNGIIGAAMLGLGRALGETIAVALILSMDFRPTAHVLAPGGGSVAALIANLFPEAGADGRQALIAAGLALFVITLLVNLGARAVVDRRPAEAA